MTKQLKNKIKMLEAKIMQNKAELKNQKQCILSRLNKNKNRLLVAEMVLGGFTFGYLLGGYKKPTYQEGKKFVGLGMFFKLNRWISRFNRHLRNINLISS